MKGIYIAAVDEKNPVERGVINKIYGQAEAFRINGVALDIAHMDNKCITINGSKSEVKIYNKPSNFFFHKLLNKYFLANLDSYNEYDFAYIRFSRGDIQYYKLIKDLYRKNIKVVVEIPTYPYRQQFKYTDIKNQIYNIIDWIIWKVIKKYIYRISITNNIDTIEGIKCIKISNGIDTNKIRIVKKRVPEKNNSINLVGIANISKWHGYDRVIKGIANFYKDGNNKKERVEFYLIGEGKEKQNLINLTKKLGIEDKIHFLGVKLGNELDEIMDKMDIGVSSLALHRAGGGHDPIKTKEILGRGLPVILGYKDKLVNMSLPYVIKVSEDDKDINITEIVDIYKYRDMDKLEIRKYAEENLSWNSQMNKVVKEIG